MHFQVRIGLIRPGFVHFWPLLDALIPWRVSHGGLSFVEDEAVKIAGKIGQRQFGLGTRQANGADKQSEPVLLMRNDMFDPGLHG